MALAFSFAKEKNVPSWFKTIIFSKRITEKSLMNRKENCDVMQKQG